MSQAVYFFGGFQASQNDIDSWLKSARTQKPGVDFNAFPWPDDTRADDDSAVKGFSKGGQLDSVVKSIQGSKADTVYIVGHSSGCAIANKVDSSLTNINNIVLVAIDGFRPSDKQLDRNTTQVWGAECEGKKSLNYPGFDKGRRKIYTATGCKTMWALHFSMVNSASKDGVVYSVKTGYANCVANLLYL
jgi:hypothetical protein